MTRKICFSLFLILAVGCASLKSGYETPVVTLTSFDAIPTQGLIPQFKIGLHIVNPNRTPLDLKGASYTIALEGHKVMTGVSNQLPHIDAYGEADIVLNASVDLFNSIGFLSDLISSRKTDSLAYNFTAKLDAGSFHPLIRVSRQGKISLSGNTP